MEAILQNGRHRRGYLRQDPAILEDLITMLWSRVVRHLLKVEEDFSSVQKLSEVHLSVGRADKMTTLRCQVMNGFYEII